MKNQKIFIDYECGDIVHHTQNNEIGTVLKVYGQRIHVNFSRSGEQTVFANQITKVED